MCAGKPVLRRYLIVKEVYKRKQVFACLSQVVGHQNNMENS
jgi:hypothetical protein